MGGSERSPSQSAKARGSELYSGGDYAAAEAAFSEAISMCGTADSSEMHIFYSNRCAARMQLGNLDGALEDAVQCTKLSSRWPKGWSRLGTCQMQKGRLTAAVESLKKASELEPDNATYKTQLANARARLAPPRPPPDQQQSNAGGARAPPPAAAAAAGGGGPGVTERAAAWGLEKFTAAQTWWQDLNPDQKRLIAAGAAVAAILVLYQLYNAFFGYSHYDSYDYYGGGGGGGWTWGFWGLVMLAAWRVPPMFGYAPFFGMSMMHFIWLLQMLQNQGGGRRYGGGGFRNAGLFGGRRRW